MDDVLLKGIGLYLLAILSSIIAFLAFLIGHSVNGIPVEFAVLLGSILGSSEVLLILVIKHYFKILD